MLRSKTSKRCRVCLREAIKPKRAEREGRTQDCPQAPPAFAFSSSRGGPGTRRPDSDWRPSTDLNRRA